MIIAGKKLEDMSHKQRADHCSGNGYSYVRHSDGYQITRINKLKDEGTYEVRVYDNQDPQDEERPLTIRAVRF